MRRRTAWLLRCIFSASSKSLGKVLRQHWTRCTEATFRRVAYWEWVACTLNLIVVAIGWWLLGYGLGFGDVGVLIPAIWVLFTLLEVDEIQIGVVFRAAKLLDLPIVAIGHYVWIHFHLAGGEVFLAVVGIVSFAVAMMMWIHGRGVG